MALNLRRGNDEMKKAAERSGGGKFMPSMKWDSGETKYIQFITAIEDIPTVLFHNFIITGFRDDGNKIYNSFISRKDPAIDGSEGYDELVDRFKETPTNKSIALALELEPVYKTQGKRKTIEGFEPAYRTFTTKDDEEKSVPAVQLIIQSPSNFFGWLSTYADMKPIEGSIFAVKRVGKSTDTRYDFMEVTDEGLDLTDVLEEVEFDFEAYLEDLADEDRMRELLSDLDDDFVVNPYNKNRKKDKDNDGGGKSQRTRVKAAAKEEAEAPEEADEPSRKRRFAALKSEMKGD